MSQAVRLPPISTVLSSLIVLLANSNTEKSAAEIAVDVRLCKECNSTLFSRRDFELETQAVDSSTRAYTNLTQFEYGIRMLLPRFQKLLNMLQDPDRHPTSAQLAEASKTRKRLMDSFTQYDIAARRIRDLPTTSPTQQKLQKAVYQQASNFLHLHMLPLKTLPKILKHATPHGTARPNGAPGPLPNGKPHSSSALASIKYNALDPEASSQMSSASSQISALEAEEKSLRERLIVLEEQKFFVREMIADAKQRRKFDEVAALTGNVEDLGREIDSVQGLLGGLDFEGAYTGAGSMGVLASPPLKGKR